MASIESIVHEIIDDTGDLMSWIMAEDPVFESITDVSARVVVCTRVNVVLECVLINLSGHIIRQGTIDFAAHVPRQVVYDNLEPNEEYSFEFSIVNLIGETDSYHDINTIQKSDVQGAVDMPRQLLNSPSAFQLEDGFIRNLPYNIIPAHQINEWLNSPSKPSMGVIDRISQNGTGIATTQQDTDLSKKTFSQFSVDYNKLHPESNTGAKPPSNRSSTRSVFPSLPPPKKLFPPPLYQQAQQSEKRTRLVPRFREDILPNNVDITLSNAEGHCNSSYSITPPQNDLISDSGRFLDATNVFSSSPSPHITKSPYFSPEKNGKNGKQQQEEMENNINKINVAKKLSPPSNLISLPSSLLNFPDGLFITKNQPVQGYTRVFDSSALNSLQKFPLLYQHQQPIYQHHQQGFISYDPIKRTLVTLNKHGNKGFRQISKSVSPSSNPEVLFRDRNWSYSKIGRKKRHDSESCTKKLSHNIDEKRKKEERSYSLNVKDTQQHEDDNLNILNNNVTQPLEGSRQINTEGQNSISNIIEQSQRENKNNNSKISISSDERLITDDTTSIVSIDDCQEAVDISSSFVRNITLFNSEQHQTSLNQTSNLNLSMSRGFWRCEPVDNRIENEIKPPFPNVNNDLLAKSIGKSFNEKDESCIAAATISSSVFNSSTRESKLQENEGNIINKNREDKNALSEDYCTGANVKKINMVTKEEEQNNFTYHQKQSPSDSIFDDDYDDEIPVIPPSTARAAPLQFDLTVCYPKLARRQEIFDNKLKMNSFSSSSERTIESGTNKDEKRYSSTFQKQSEMNDQVHLNNFSNASRKPLLHNDDNESIFDSLSVSDDESNSVSLPPSALIKGVADSSNSCLFASNLTQNKLPLTNEVALQPIITVGGTKVLPRRGLAPGSIVDSFVQPSNSSLLNIRKKEFIFGNTRKQGELPGDEFENFEKTESLYIDNKKITATTTNKRASSSSSPSSSISESHQPNESLYQQKSRNRGPSRAARFLSIESEQEEKCSDEEICDINPSHIKNGLDEHLYIDASNHHQLSNVVMDENFDIHPTVDTHLTTTIQASQINRISMTSNIPEDTQNDTRSHLERQNEEWAMNDINCEAIQQRNHVKFNISSYERANNYINNITDDENLHESSDRCHHRYPSWESTNNMVMQNNVLSIIDESKCSSSTFNSNSKNPSAQASTRPLLLAPVSVVTHTIRAPSSYPPTLAFQHSNACSSSSVISSHNCSNTQTPSVEYHPRQLEQANDSINHSVKSINFLQPSDNLQEHFNQDKFSKYTDNILNRQSVADGSAPSHSLSSSAVHPQLHHQRHGSTSTSLISKTGVHNSYNMRIDIDNENHENHEDILYRSNPSHHFIVKDHEEHQIVAVDQAKIANEETEIGKNMAIPLPITKLLHSSFSERLGTVDDDFPKNNSVNRQGVVRGMQDSALRVPSQSKQTSIVHNVLEDILSARQNKSDVTANLKTSSSPFATCSSVKTTRNLPSRPSSSLKRKSEEEASPSLLSFVSAQNLSQTQQKNKDQIQAETEKELCISSSGSNTLNSQLTVSHGLAGILLPPSFLKSKDDKTTNKHQNFRTASLGGASDHSLTNTNIMPKKSIATKNQASHKQVDSKNKIPFTDEHSQEFTQSTPGSSVRTTNSAFLNREDLLTSDLNDQTDASNFETAKIAVVGVVSEFRKTYATKMSFDGPSTSLPSLAVKKRKDQSDTGGLNSSNDDSTSANYNLKNAFHPNLSSTGAPIEHIDKSVGILEFATPIPLISSVKSQDLTELDQKEILPHLQAHASSSPNKKKVLCSVGELQASNISSECNLLKPAAVNHSQTASNTLSENSNQHVRESLHYAIGGDTSKALHEPFSLSKSSTRSLDAIQAALHFIGDRETSSRLIKKVSGSHSVTIREQYDNDQDFASNLPSGMTSLHCSTASINLHATVSSSKNFNLDVTSVGIKKILPTLEINNFESEVGEVNEEVSLSDSVEVKDEKENMNMIDTDFNLSTPAALLSSVHNHTSSTTTHEINSNRPPKTNSTVRHHSLNGKSLNRDDSDNEDLHPDDHQQGLGNRLVYEDDTKDAIDSTKVKFDAVPYFPNQTHLLKKPLELSELVSSSNDFDENYLQNGISQINVLPLSSTISIHENQLNEMSGASTDENQDVDCCSSSEGTSFGRKCDSDDEEADYLP